MLQDKYYFALQIKNKNKNKLQRLYKLFCSHIGQPGFPKGLLASRNHS